jgi:hypothetical protein
MADDHGIFGPVISFAVDAQIRSADGADGHLDADRAGGHLGFRYLFESQVALGVNDRSFHSFTITLLK